MKLISLTQGFYAKIDDEDYDDLSKHKWYALRNRNMIYAARRYKNKTVLMHREIFNLTDCDTKLDHEDRDGLNNQKSNIRISTVSQNNANRRKKPNSISKYLGVTISGYRANGSPVWRTLLEKDGKQYTDSSRTEIEAAIKYNNLAKLHHGEFANLNII